MDDRQNDDYLRAAATQLGLPLREADWPDLRIAFAALAAQADILAAAAPLAEVEAAPRFVP